MLRSFLLRSAVAAATVAVWPIQGVLAQAPASHLRAPDAEGPRADLRGLVRDDSGRPVQGAVVSAFGAATAFALSDAEGRFQFGALPAGPYLVRVHLTGYVSGRSRLVQLGSGGTSLALTLARLVGSDDAPPVLAASVGSAGRTAVEDPSPQTQRDVDHSHDEVAWRLRHARRGVLKDVDSVMAGFDRLGSESLHAETGGGLWRAVESPARIASTLFADLALSGQVDLLTTTSFNRPQDLFLDAHAPRPIAYLSLNAPMATGVWTMRGAITQGDLASWIVAGSYVSDPSGGHAYQAGLSFSMQRYMGGNADALAAMRDGSRNVGTLYAYDTWTLTPRLSIDYGGKYARYDYLSDQALVSPRGGIVLRPLAGDDLRLRVSVSHRETAPGAEEFIPPSVGVWLPPERTFSPMDRGGVFRPQRLDHAEVAAERQWAGEILVGVRLFRQQVADQTVTLFGLGGSGSTGHYHVASAGAFDALGWGVSVSRTMSGRLRASVEYSQAEADWSAVGPDTDVLSRVAAAAVRSAERIHDVTAAMENVVAATATRVFVVYKLNNAFAAANADGGRRGARFNVQVNQPLPFLNFTNARWEMLVAVSNLFREDLADSSVYDELLVVRPPKRVLGGVTVRF